MKKILLPLAGSLMVFSVPTSAAQASDYPFKSFGQCNSWLQWQSNNVRRGTQSADTALTCQQGNDGLWYLVPA